MNLTPQYNAVEVAALAVCTFFLGISIGFALWGNGVRTVTVPSIEYVDRIVEIPQKTVDMGTKWVQEGDNYVPMWYSWTEKAAGKSLMGEFDYKIHEAQRSMDMAKFSDYYEVAWDDIRAGMSGRDVCAHFDYNEREACLEAFK